MFILVYYHQRLDKKMATEMIMKAKKAISFDTMLTLTCDLAREGKARFDTTFILTCDLA